MPADQEYAVVFGQAGLNLRDEPALVGLTGFTDTMNWRLDERGAPVKRLGYQNYADPFGGTNSIPAIPLELATYAPTGQAATILAYCADGNVYASPGDGTWTSIGSGYSTTARPSFAVVGEKIYWTNGSDTVQQWDGSTLTSVSAAPKGTLATTWRNRLWISGVATTPHRVYWSGISDGSDWTNVSTNFVDIFGPHGDPVTAIYPGPNTSGNQWDGADAVLVYTISSVHRVIDDSDNILGITSGGANVLIDPGTGCVNHRTIATVNGLVYSVARDGIYATPGHTRLALQSAKLGRVFHDRLNSALRVNMTAVAWEGSYLLAATRLGEAANGIVVEVHTQLPPDPSDHQHPIMVSDVPAAAWARYPATLGDQLYFTDSSITPSDNRQYLRRYAIGGTDADGVQAGQPITATGRTGSTTFGTTHPKRIRRIQLAGRGSVSTSVAADFETGIGETQYFDLGQSDGPIWGSFTWGSFTWGSAGAINTDTRWYTRRGRYYTFTVAAVGSDTSQAASAIGAVGVQTGGATIYSAVIDVTPLSSDT